MHVGRSQARPYASLNPLPANIPREGPGLRAWTGEDQHPPAPASDTEQSIPLGVGTDKSAGNCLVGLPFCDRLLPLKSTKSLIRRLAAHPAGQLLVFGIPAAEKQSAMFGADSRDLETKAAGDLSVADEEALEHSRLATRMKRGRTYVGRENRGRARVKGQS